MAGIDLWDLLLRASLVSKVVLVLLVFLSVYTWGIYLSKLKQLKKAKKSGETFIVTFRRVTNFEDIIKVSNQYPLAPQSHMCRAAYQETSFQRKRSQNGMVLSLSSVERILERAIGVELGKLETKIWSLATTATIAPFIGLFGTVWGVMISFLNIGIEQSASLATVAPGIAEALIATALGLVVAIPSVVTYNKLLAHIGY